MFGVAVPGTAIAWSLQYLDSRALLGVPAPVWPLLALLVWWLIGGRAALLLLIAGWTLCRAGWLLEGHLPEHLAGQDLVVRGTVCDFPRRDTQALRLVLERDSRLPADLPRRLFLSWYDAAPDVRPGQRWQLRVRLKSPRGLLNPGGSDFEQWLYLRGIGGFGYVRQSRLNRSLTASSWQCPIGRARGFIADRIRAEVGAKTGGAYVLGVAVGATADLTDADWDLLRETGTTHLLAISGMNIAMVAAPLLLAGPLLGRFWPRFAGRPHVGTGSAVVVAAIYSAMAGFEVSTVRALVMLAVAAGLSVGRRRIESLDLLGTAALAVIIIDPRAVMSAGFWLSFVAVVCLLLAAVPGLKAASGRRAPAKQPWAAGLDAVAAVAIVFRAQGVLALGLAPLTLAWFEQVSLVGPFANLIAVPLFTVAVMPLTLLGTVSALFAPWLGGPLLRVAADVMAVLVQGLQAAATWSLAVWRPPGVGGAAMMLGLAGAVLLCWWRPVPSRALGAALMLPALAGTGSAPAQLRVVALDVGQGLAVLVQTANHALLYDAGPRFRLRDAGETVVVPALRRLGIERLDMMLVSHDDQDHRGGVGSVLDHYPAPVMASPRSDLVVGRGLVCARGIEWKWDGVRFAVLSPERGAAAESDNDGSCVLSVVAPAGTVLLPGDIGRRKESELVHRGLVSGAAVVVAAHHGSRTSSGPDFVAATTPVFVIISAGHRNRWGFPIPEVSHRWQAAGACVLNTAESGAIVIEARAGDWWITRLQRIHRAHLWTARGREDAACLRAAGPVAALR